MKLAKLGDEKERKKRVLELMDEVGLDPDSRFRLPHQFSGGQKQRIAITRATGQHTRLHACAFITRPLRGARTRKTFLRR